MLPRLLPVLLSLLVLAAHVLRLGNPLLVLLVLALLIVVWIRRPWAMRTVRVALVIGALEWLRTLVVLANERLALGEPFLRMVAILAAVAALTALSATAFRSPRLRAYYAG